MKRNNFKVLLSSILLSILIISLFGCTHSRRKIKEVDTKITDVTEVQPTEEDTMAVLDKTYKEIEKELNNPKSSLNKEIKKAMDEKTKDLEPEIVSILKKEVIENEETKGAASFIAAIELEMRKIGTNSDEQINKLLEEEKQYFTPEEMEEMTKSMTENKVPMDENEHPAVSFYKHMVDELLIEINSMTNKGESK